MVLATLGLAFGAVQPASASTVDPKTGVRLPDIGEIEAAVPKDWTGLDNPVEDSSGLKRLDATDDAVFYKDARIVEHVDDGAVQLLRNYLAETAIHSDTMAVLDLCSSWTSHLETVSRLPPRVAGLGMNAAELEQNKQLTEWVVQDLNRKPKLPYTTDSFDVVLCQLSIDYLTRPLEVCQEIGRILRPGGRVHILFSNRLFLSKAVALWTGADDIDHAYTVASYLHYCDGGLMDIRARDLSKRKGSRIVGDPLYVVTATKA